MLFKDILDKRKKLTKEVIRYVLYKLKKVEGRKKLMKLMFLIEHYDPKTKTISEEPKIGNEFIVYYFGPFSFEVYDDMLEMIKDNEIKEEWFTLTPLFEKKDFEIDNDLKKHVDMIIKEFGKLSPHEIEEKSLKLLGIKKEQKAELFGIPIKVFLVERN